MVERVIKALIGLALLVGLVYLVIWVFASLGIALPHMVLVCIWVIVVLLAVLYLYRMFQPFVDGWFPPRV